MKIDKYEDANICIQVETKGDGHIATMWDKQNELKHDRRVYEFETYGGAVSKAFDLLVDYISDLKRMG